MTEHLLSHQPALGDLIVSRYRDENNQRGWAILQADPEVGFADELLTAAVEGFDHPYTRALRVWLHEHEEAECAVSCPATHQRHGELPCFWGALIYFEGHNRTVVYRVVAHVWLQEVWIARWPD